MKLAIGWVQQWLSQSQVNIFVRYFYCPFSIQHKWRNWWLPSNVGIANKEELHRLIFTCSNEQGQNGSTEKLFWNIYLIVSFKHQHFLVIIKILSKLTWSCYFSYSKSNKIELFFYWHLFSYGHFFGNILAYCVGLTAFLLLFLFVFLFLFLLFRLLLVKKLKFVNLFSNLFLLLFAFFLFLLLLFLFNLLFLFFLLLLFLNLNLFSRKFLKIFFIVHLFFDSMLVFVRLFERHYWYIHRLFIKVHRIPMAFLIIVFLMLIRFFALVYFAGA